MCSLCNGSGGVNKQHSWGAEFIPCPGPSCDFDYKAEQERILNLVKESEFILKGLETA